MTVVIDASALLDSMDADRPGWIAMLEELAFEHDLVAPSLLSWEVGNVIFGRRAERYGRTHADRLERLETLLEGVELVPPTSASRQKVADILRKHGLTFYDAAYLELAASIEESILVTQDGGLLRAARKVLGAARAMSLEG